MQLSIKMTHEEHMFEYTFENDEEGFRMRIDGKPMFISPAEIHELGLMLKRVGSFCKDRCDDPVIFDGFETQWFTGHRRKQEFDE